MARQQLTETLRRAVFSFWEHGYADCSVKALEAATGLHTGSLYHHFKNKDHLYLDTVRFYVAEMLLPQLQQVVSLDELQTFFSTRYRHPFGEVRGTCFLIQATYEVAGHTADNQAFKDELSMLQGLFEEKINITTGGANEFVELLMDLYIALHVYSEHGEGRHLLDKKVKQRFDLIRRFCPV